MSQFNVQKLFKDIQSTLEGGGVVWVLTALRATKYTKKHKDMFFLSPKDNLRVQHGRSSVMLASPKMLFVRIELEPKG